MSYSMYLESPLQSPLQPALRPALQSYRGEEEEPQRTATEQQVHDAVSNLLTSQDAFVQKEEEVIIFSGMAVAYMLAASDIHDDKRQPPAISSATSALVGNDISSLKAELQRCKSRDPQAFIKEVENAKRSALKAREDVSLELLMPRKPL